MTGTEQLQIKTFMTSSLITPMKPSANDIYLQLAASAGLDAARIDRYVDHTRHVDTATANFGPPLTGEALQIWKAYLSSSIPIEDYVFPEPPQEVLQAITDAMQLGIFKRVQFWMTPAYGNRETMAVGYVDDYGEECFPIVRWGVSLPDFTEIQTTVIKNKISAILFYLSLTMVITLFIIATLVFGWIVLAGVLTALLVIGLSWWATSWAKSHYELRRKIGT